METDSKLRLSALGRDEVTTLVRSVQEERFPALSAIASARLRMVWVYLCLMMLVCFLLQLGIDHSSDNTLAGLMAVISGGCASFYIFRPRVILDYPLSSVALLGLVSLACLVPFFGQSLSLRSFVYNLNRPLTSVALTSSATLLAVFSHVVYANVGIFRFIVRVLRKYFVRPLGLFRTPTITQLYLIGSIGIIASVYSTGFGDENAIVTGDAFGKLAQAVRPFAIAPVITLFPGLYQGRKKASLFMFLSYFFVLLGLSAVTNARSVSAGAIIVVVLAALFWLLSGQFRRTRSNTVMLLVLPLIGVSLIPVMTRLSDAIVTSRNARSTVSQGELLISTVYAFLDPNLTSPEATKRPGNYSEEYGRSDLINRFSVLKYTDNVVFETESLSVNQSQQIKEDSQRRLLAVLPQPILTGMGLDAGKDLKPYSSGDLYAVLSGSFPFLGSFLTGSSLANSLHIHGWLSPIMYFLVIIGVFTTKDSLALERRPTSTLPMISVCGLITLNQTFLSGLYSDSYANLVSQILRGYLQSLLLTGLLFLAVGVPFSRSGR